MIAGNRTGWALSSCINAPCPKTPTAVESPATGLTLPCPPGRFPHSTEPPAPARLPSLQPTESTSCWNCKSCARNQQVVINYSHWSRQKARSLSSACSWVRLETITSLQQDRVEPCYMGSAGYPALSSARRACRWIQPSFNLAVAPWH